MPRPSAKRPGSSRDAAAEPVELVRAERSSDLWSAIEAAQSGRVVVHEEPVDAAEEEAMERLAGALDRAVETWEEEGLQNKAPLLRPIDESLAALASRGVSLYWGCIERMVVVEGGASVPMQVAVFALSRSSGSICSVEMPVLLDAGATSGEGEEE